MSLKLTETSKQNRKVTLVTLHDSRILDTFLYIYRYMLFYFFCGLLPGYRLSLFSRSFSEKPRAAGAMAGIALPRWDHLRMAGVITDDDFLKTYIYI